MDDCENILMVAGGFGIAAHLPYLKELIYGYNARKVRARRIYLVWQVRDIGKS
jgi:NAD(P)H-flavin reductase